MYCVISITYLYKYSNLSLIYAHCVHRKKKMRKDMRGTKYTYYNGRF